MRKIKNRLIIALIFINFNINHANANDSIISNISDKMVISVKNSDINYELSDIYIPSEILPVATDEARRTIGNQVTFRNLSSLPNRHGNYNADIIKYGSQVSLQEILLEKGLGFAYLIENSQNAASLFSAEEKARKSKSGLWKDDGFTIKKIDDLTTDYKKNLNKFTIIEGIVDNIYSTKKSTYINFGKDWKTDFTLQIENKVLKKPPGFFPEKLKGKVISARGWLEDYNGPFMKIYNVSNIQIISGNNQ